jgi:hypothetical protein
MSLKDVKDKLEIGLKPDAPYRPTNLPASQQPHAPHPPGTEPPPAGPPTEETDNDEAAPGKKPPAR